VDGLVTASTQRSSTVRNTETFEVLVASGASFDPAALVWTLSRGARTEFALGVTRTLDGTGQPLGDVRVEEQGPAGAVERSSESESGIATIAEQAGAFYWKFSRDGHLPVWREGTLVPGQVLFVPSPWLQERSEASAALSVLNGGEVSGDGAVVRFAGGAFPSTATATLTPIGGQSLPGLLPAGWSPLFAFWLELTVEPQASAEAELPLAERLAPGERAFLVRFDTSTRRWIETGAPVAISGDLATTALAASGAYAIVVPDSGPSAPPAPVADVPLEPTATPFPLPDGLGATGSVTPPVAAASADPLLVTAKGEVVVTHAGPLPSGLVLRATIDEQYALRDGATRTAPRYETFFVAYQRPGDGDPLTLHARFPLRPQLAYGSDELDEASIAVDVLPVSAFEGGFFDPNGGRVAAPGLQINAPPGAVDRPRAVELRAIDVARFADLLPSGDALVAFEFAAELLEGAHVGAIFGQQPPDANFVLTRFVQSGGRSGLEPRLRYASDEFGFLRSVEPSSGPRLPGITGSGTYVLVRVDGPRALVEGVARDTGGQAIAGLAVTIGNEPWLTFSASDGRWQLVAPVGQAEVVVTDLRNGDRGTQSVFLADPAAVATADLATQPAGPRVVEIDPEDGATDARTSSPIRVLFSERVAPLAPGDLLLTDAVGNPVLATLSTNLARTEATLLPVNPLASGTLHTLTLAATIADPTGLPLEGPRTFTFTTQSLAARGAGAQLVSWEPGAQTSECDDVPGFDPANAATSCAVGSPGTADPDVAVILVNETRGTTATVRSRLDGSFENFIEADVDDFLAATFINANGTRIRVPLSRQLFDDGSVALFQGGGILEAESDGGPVQIQIEPGAIKNKNKFQVEPLDAAALLAMLQDSPPEDAKLLGTGLRVTVEGDPPEGEANLSFPVDPAALDLPPGAPPEDGAFAAAILRETEGGTAYEVVDKLRFADGKIASNTFPFLGLLFSAGDASDIFSMIVVPVLLGTKPTTVTGRVLECPGGACLGLDTLAALQVGRPLRGAFVTLSNPATGGVQRTALEGRIQPGMVYATSGLDGRFALVAPSLAAGYVLSAVHPKHAQPVLEPVLGIFDFTVSGTIEKNLIFDAPFPGSVSSPVRVNAAHEPIYPGPGLPATLQVNASHGSGAPTIAISLERVEPLVEGVQVSTADVQIGSKDETMPSSTRKRVTVPITATEGKALLATFRIRASVASAGLAGNIPPQEILHSIAFGVGPSPPRGDVIPADDSDEVGPVVVSTIPAEGAVAVSPGDTLTLFFNEAIDKAAEDDPGALTLAANGGGDASFSVEVSEDQRALRVRPGPLALGEEYSLTVTSAVKDVSGNAFDQEPGSPGPQSFTLRFSTPEPVVHELPGIESGGGVVLGHGAYAFALDRDAAPELVVLDVSSPNDPQVAARVALPGVPRDLAFIPRYRSVIRPDDAARERDILAVVGGDLGTQSIDNDGNVFFPPQYLRLFDVTNPANPVRISHTTLSLRPATITRVEWRPPFLVYLELGSDLQAVGQILLQELMIGTNLTQQEVADLPLFGVRGIDGNGDGDFTDADEGDRLPEPNPSAEFFGKVGACGIDDTTQRILDFDFAPGYCGLTLTEGKLRQLGGGLGADVPPAYRTVEFESQPIDRVQGTLNFGVGARPKRMLALFDQRIDVGDTTESRNLVLVSLSPDADGKPKLAVIDVSLPAAPVLLAKIEFPEELGLGLLQSVSKRSDGLLAVATTTSIVLLDPTKLLAPAPTAAAVPHASVVGIIPEAGSGAQSLDGNAAGIQLVSLGGRNQLVQSAPRLRFVAFTGDAPPVSVDDLIDDPEAIETELKRLREVASLAPARLRDDAGATKTLDPPSRTVHYHVLIDMPGGAGTTVPLTLESLNRSGRSLPNQGRNFPPVRAATGDTLESLGQETRADCDAPIETFTARQLSTDKSSPYYNLYLSPPFALTYERIAESELQTLRTSPVREILWSGHFVRASLDPLESGNPAIGAYASQVDTNEKVVRPGASVTARALAPPSVVGPNPPPPVGPVAAPGTFGLVNAGNGEMRVETVDMLLPSPRMPIVFQRTLGGQDLHEGAFGRGWDLNYAQRIVPLDADVFPDGQRMPLVERNSEALSTRAQTRDVVLQTGKSSAVLFEHAGTSPPPEIASDPLLQAKGWLDASDYYLPQKGVFDALLRFDDGQFLRVTPDGTQYWYAAGGRLERIYHRWEENRHVLTYNDRDELIRIDDESVTEERFLRIGYFRFANDPIFDADVDLETDSAFVAGKIARLVDSVGREIEFEYNDDGLLQKRLGVPITGANGGFSGRPTLEYLSADTCSGDLRGVRSDNGAGGGALFVADVAGENAQPVVTGGSGVAGAVSVSPPGANEASASDGSVTSVSGPSGNTEFTFDENGLPKKIAAAGKDYDTTFNEHGLLEHVKYPADSEVFYNYDVANVSLRSRGNLLAVEHEPGSRGGDPITRSWSYDGRYNQISGVVVDENGNTIDYSAGSDGLDIESIHYGSAGTAIIHYNDKGQIDDSTSPLGIAYDVDYDASTGFKTSETVGSLSTGLGYDGSIAAKLGNPTTLSPPGRPPIVVSYDERGLRTSVAQGARASRFGYDENGNPVTIEHETGGGTLVETRAYEPNGFLKSITVAGLPVAGGGTTVTEFEPDAAFRIHKITYPGGAQKTFRYGPQGHVEGYTLGNVDVEYQLDAHGNPTETRAGGDVIRTFTWDGHDRMKQMVEKAEGGDAIYDYSYFGSGALASARASDASGPVHSFEVTGIDALGRPTGVRYDGTTADAVVGYGYASGSVITNGPVDAATHLYDTAGLISEFSDSGQTIGYGRDAAGASETVTVTEDALTNVITLGHDALGNLESVSDSVGDLFSYTRRADGAATQVTDAAGGVTQQTFTLLGELLTRTLPQGLSGIELEYGASRKAAAMLDPSGVGNTYTYTAAFPYQVQSVTRRDGAVTSVSGRDARGNPTAMTIPGGNLTQTFDLQGRLLSQEYAAGDQPFARTMSWDAIDRVHGATYDSGGASGSVTYSYDALGPLLGADFQHPSGGFPIAYAIRGDGARTGITYPSGTTVTEGRGPDSRLTSLAGGGSLLTVSSFAGRERPENALLGNAIQETRNYDARGRLLAQRYEAGGQPLADFRYLYDPLNNPTIRQDVHRGGRADFFAYDAIGRLARADVGARPDSGSETPRVFPGFAPTLGGFLPGRYARGYQYEPAGLDHLVAAPPENPDALELPPFGQSFAGHDALLHATSVDGFARGATDPLGNVKRTQLAVRARCPVATPCDAAPRLVPATLFYDGASHLVKVERDDGVTVEYDYQHDGLFHTRRVRVNGTLESTRTYVWDGPRLLEEYESSTLVGRYFYRDGDAPFAADLKTGAALERFFLLREANLSVRAVADDAGVVRERVWYDAYGQPVLEGRDTSPPEIAAIVATSDGVRVQFSEPILAPFDTAPGVAPAGVATSVASAVTLRSGATAIPAQVTLEESAPGFPFGTVLRVQFTHQPGATLTLDAVAGALRDEWGNAVAARTLLFTDASTPDAVLLALAPAPTAPPRLAKSALGQPFLFHGQWFDYDAGLVFLRARHYDPLTGQFLQRDPDGYIASVNAYAGFANNPVGMRDPLGRNPAKQFKSIGILESGVFDGMKHTVPSEASRIAQVASADTVIRRARREAGNAAQGIANVNDTARILDKDSARLPTDLDPHLATESGSVRVPQADPTLVDQSVRSGAPVALPDDSTVIRGAPVGPPSPAARLDASINPPGGAGGAPVGGSPPGPPGRRPAGGGDWDESTIVDNPDHPAVEQMLFRGDTRSPDEVIAAGGYHPRGNGQNVAIHVMGGKTVRAFPQDMVSTSVDPSIAAGFAGETGFVAIVSGRGRALDVEPFMRSARMRGGEGEFVALGGIPLEDIVGWRPVVPNGNGGLALGTRFIANPGYIP
jgi:RHS repeat-associated protein